MKKDVWELYAHAIARTGPRATLYEWDEDIPDFATVHGEAKKALKYRPPLARGPRSTRRAGPPVPELPRLERWMQAVIVHPGRRREGRSRPLRDAPHEGRRGAPRDPALEDDGAARAARGLPGDVPAAHARRPRGRLSRPRGVPRARALSRLRPRVRRGPSLPQLHVRAPRRPRAGVPQENAPLLARAFPLTTSRASSARSPRSSKSTRRAGAARASSPPRRRRTGSRGASPRLRRCAFCSFRHAAGPALDALKAGKRPSTRPRATWTAAAPPPLRRLPSGPDARGVPPPRGAREGTDARGGASRGRPRGRKSRSRPAPSRARFASSPRKASCAKAEGRSP